MRINTEFYSEVVTLRGQRSDVKGHKSSLKRVQDITKKGTVLLT